MRIKLFNSDYLNIIELNTTGDNENYVKGDFESKYIEGEVFCLFAGCFERAEKLFDILGSTKYNSRNIVPLKNELSGKLERLLAIRSLDDFYNFIDQVFFGQDFLDKLSADEEDWEMKWRFYLDEIILLNQDLLELVDKCISEEGVLWVIGY